MIVTAWSVNADQQLVGSGQLQPSVTARPPAATGLPDAVLKSCQGDRICMRADTEPRA